MPVHPPRRCDDRYKPERQSLKCTVALILGIVAASNAQEKKADIERSPQAAAPNPPAVRTLNLGEGVQLKMALIPAGSFMIGTDSALELMLEKYGGREADYRNEYPQRKVQVEEPFYAGINEVTVAQFRRFADVTGYKTEAETEGWCYAWRRDHWEKVAGMNWRAPGFAQSNDHPVVCVTWSDAVGFCRWLTRHTNMTVGLPTEIEWEYACRAGTQTAYWWGDELDTTGTVANLADTGHWEKRIGLRLMPMDDHHQFTSPVGRYRANPFGLHDMIGNVWEWCADEYKPYAAGHLLEPVDLEPSSFRVLRGGSWGDEAWNCRSATRDWCSLNARGHNAGFRVVAVCMADRPIPPPS